ncbi:MAG TPA: hypothetical protein VHI93_04855 [Candidatus Thermoplasmatota archaeon]|nr:hypothetical protein [Candidatus Thermoplasmatota archaeon]
MTRSPLHPRRTLPTTTAFLLLGGLLLVALATPVAATHPCPPEDMSDDCNNNGTVKVHTEGSLGSPENDPHVGCPFFVEGFNMDAASGTLTIKAWPPTGDTSVVLTVNWTADEESSEADSHHFVAGPFTLPSGHYKLFVSNTMHDKMKVFWVECEEAPTTTGPPTTQIPFFPSTAALVVGMGGALLGSLFLLRRRA